MSDERSGSGRLSPEVEQRVRASFGRQRMMTTIGATLAELAPGRVVIELPFAEAITQQHGFVHGGATATIADTACGYAALSLLPVGTGVLTVEFKANFLAPAAGERLRATGEVKRAGRTITLAVCDVEAIDGDESRLVAHMTATLIALAGRGDVVD